jgi:hypothetical protein
MTPREVALHEGHKELADLLGVFEKRVLEPLRVNAGGMTIPMEGLVQYD